MWSSRHSNVRAVQRREVLSLGISLLSEIVKRDGDGIRWKDWGFVTRDAPGTRKICQVANDDITKNVSTSQLHAFHAHKAGELGGLHGGRHSSMRNRRARLVQKRFRCEDRGTQVNSDRIKRKGSVVVGLPVRVLHVLRAQADSGQ